MKIKLGLIGYPLSHSFSKGYFSKKFEDENLFQFEYNNYPIEKIELFTELLETEKPLGLNVTIPYKQSVIPFLDRLDATASAIGAVNTIAFDKGRKIGYNTDAYGFEKSFQALLQAHHHKALVLGTGGASKAVVYVLKKLGIHFQYVSRTSGNGIWTYSDITPQTLQEFNIIINTTPLGMYPHVETLAPLPYSALTPQHYLYDLVYNPEWTAFLKKGKEKNTSVKNGLDMLHFQAEKAWEIWNRYL